MATDFRKAVDVRGYEGQYKILPDGRVWSVRRTVRSGTSFTGKDMEEYGGKFLKPSPTASGYVVTLAGPRKTVMIHALVAKGFVPGYFEGAFVGFIDGNRSNVHADNLEWITRAESQRRASLRPKRVRIPPPPRRASGALDVWDTIPSDPNYTHSTPLPWE